MTYDYVDGFSNHMVITANSIASTYMAKEEFSKLNAEEFADIYLDTFVVAMCKIEESAKKEKED